MTAKSNVIQMPELNRDREIDAAIRALTDLIYRRWIETLEMLRKAEAEGLERIEEYVPQDRLLTLKEAAAYLGYKPRTVRSWCAGTHLALQHSLIGGELRFKKLWLDQMIEKKSVKPPTIKL